MTRHAWVKEFDGAVTVCDPRGIILEMNDRAIAAFATSGGASLIGSNLLDCHPEPARTLLEGLMAARQKNVYTIEKRGVRKLVCQSPWYEGGEYRGFVELVIALPAGMPHRVRSETENRP